MRVPFKRWTQWRLFTSHNDRFWWSVLICSVSFSLVALLMQGLTTFIPPKPSIANLLESRPFAAHCSSCPDGLDSPVAHDSDDTAPSSSHPCDFPLSIPLQYGQCAPAEASTNRALPPDNKDPDTYLDHASRFAIGSLAKGSSVVFCVVSLLYPFSVPYRAKPSYALTSHPERCRT